MRRSARGEFGVNLSQIKAVVTAIDDGAVTPLFIEDDIEFNEKSNSILQSVFNELPEKWDVLYLGGHPRGPVPARIAKQHSEHLWKIQRYSFADAYSINGTSLKRFYDFWCESITQENAMYDFILGDFAGLNNGYAIYPTLCEQYDSMSAVTGQPDSKNDILARAWAAHLGPQNLTPEHRQIFEQWKKKNPGKWEQTLRNQARKR
jgi:hypothetical protein